MSPDVSRPTSVPNDEAIGLAMDDVAADMASRGKRVWEPARTETSERIARLHDALTRIAEFPIREDRSAGWHFAEVRAIARETLNGL